MFLFRMTRFEYKTLTQRVPMPRRKTKTVKRGKRKPPSWNVIVNGKRQNIQAWTKSEVRARVKDMLGTKTKLPIGFGDTIIPTIKHAA